MDTPSEKTKRYDRQLRLWGDRGQKLLESSHVCLINATATGTEILKNLVLPGVGACTIIDDHLVTKSDLGTNFFVSAGDVGKIRSQVTANLLQEMNLEVKSNFIDESFQSILESDVNFFSQFTLVIVSDVPGDNLLKLSEILWKAHIPLILAHSYGLIGYIRLVVPSHEILESHPDNYRDDLRLDVPFPELIAYMDEIDFARMDADQRNNVPYLVILYKGLQKWKTQNKFPTNYKEKKAFKAFLEDEIKGDNIATEEDNFDEALKNINHKVVPTKIPLEVQAIFEDPMCCDITPESSNFWILARAIKEFVQSEGNGCLPLQGAIPDMISSSDLYIKLQRVYQKRADRDAEIVSSHVQKILKNIGKSKGTLMQENVRAFCRNSYFINVIRYHSFTEEYSQFKFDKLRSHIDDTNIDYYIMLRAAEKFYSLYRYYPGEKQEMFESDVAQIKAILLNFSCTNGSSTCMISDDYIIEFCRYGGKEIHSVSAFIGGTAAQEIIKLITHQFVPLDNTLIYHAGSCKTTTLKL